MKISIFIFTVVFVLFSNVCFAGMQSNNYQIKDDTINIGEGEQVSSPPIVEVLGGAYNKTEENTLFKIVIFVGILIVLGTAWTLIRLKIKKRA